MSSYMAYTSDINSIRAFHSEDCIRNPLVAPEEGCTTTPSLLLAAAKMEKFRCDLEQAAEESKNTDNNRSLIDEICERFGVKVGIKLLQMLPEECPISAEVDVAFSSGTEAAISRAARVVSLYEEQGVSKDRVLVKLALSRESIEACKALEARGIKCSMALLRHQQYARDGQRLRSFISNVLKLSEASQSLSVEVTVPAPLAVAQQEIIPKKEKATTSAEEMGFSMKMLTRSGSSNSVISTECPTTPEGQDDDDSTSDDMNASDDTFEDSHSGAEMEDASGLTTGQNEDVSKFTQLDFERLRSFASSSMTPLESVTEHGESSTSFPSESTNAAAFLLAAAKMQSLRCDLKQAAAAAKARVASYDQEGLMAEVRDRFAVKVGAKLLALLPEQESLAMEVDPSLCFDTEASVAKASKMLHLYDTCGVSKERIIVKLAPSWESIQACKLLEARGIRCEMALLQSQQDEKDVKHLQAYLRKVLKL